MAADIGLDSLDAEGPLPAPARRSAASPMRRPFGSAAEARAETDADALVALLQNVAEADQRALRRLYDRTSAKLYGVILRIVRDRSDADDVLQEVYLTVWRRADRYDVRQGSAIAWLCVIARNRAIDVLRRRPASSLRAFEAELEAVPDAAPSTLMLLEADDRLRELHGVLNRIDPRAAWAIRTAFFSDVTYGRLADLQGVPVATMKSRIRRGLLELRRLLDADAE